MNLIFNIAFALLICIFSLKNHLISAQNRIVGGDEADIEDFPYMLELVLPEVNSHKAVFCGAGIISKEWAVTAAHCFLNPDIDKDRIHVLAGTADTRHGHRDEHAKKYHISEYITNEHFIGIGSNQSIEGDIAVIKVHPPFKFNSATKPLKLPEKGKKIKDDMATIAGWGKTDPNEESTSKLRYVKLPKVPTKSCREHYKKHNIRVHEGEICYGFHNSTFTEDKCQGDSGGPLVNDDNIVLGVVSKGDKCGTHGLPGMYTSTLYFRDWIKEKTGV